MIRNLRRLASIGWRCAAPTVEKTIGHLKLVQSSEFNVVRYKYVTSGVQGRRELKLKPIEHDDDDDDGNDDDQYENTESLLQNNVYSTIASEALGDRTSISHEQNVLVIQPFIKWGPNKSPIPPEVKLQEAEDLIRSLDTWNIVKSIKVPLVTIKKSFFGKGKMDELKNVSKGLGSDISKKITCVFVSVSRLDQAQKTYLESEFGVPVLDRFSVVIQILRAHATSGEAKLQIALAELPYIWHHMGTGDASRQPSKLTDSQRRMLRKREKHIKVELAKIKEQRQKVRKGRMQSEYPICAVVGYTNGGKTSLIKALTNQEKIQPKNQLFATLDVTAHEGRLPCNLKVIYIDTIGFMSDIPTGLLECFITTLEDALVADLVIHVQDVAHINVFDQRRHVEDTLEKLMFESDVQKENLLNNVINVGNKCDLVSDIDSRVYQFRTLRNRNETSESMQFVSCVKGHGIDELKHVIERNILKVTNRTKIIIRVPQSGNELPWLYKNTTVTHTESDDRNAEYTKVHVLLTDLALIKFKNEFLKKKGK